MRLTRTTHRFAAWLAMLAMLLGALAPTVAQAVVAAQGGPGWVQVCSASGMVWVTPGALPANSAVAPNSPMARAKHRITPATSPGAASGRMCWNTICIFEAPRPSAAERIDGGTAASAEAALFAGLNSGQAYLNLHTTAFPGGEIRGQFAAVPEPGTWALMITGFGLVGATLRRRRTPLLVN